MIAYQNRYIIIHITAKISVVSVVRGFPGGGASKRPSGMRGKGLVRLDTLTDIDTIYTFYR